jgi:hypothetical protein
MCKPRLRLHVSQSRIYLIYKYVETNPERTIMTHTGNTPISSAGFQALRENPALADYFQGNSNRMAACRAMLDLLGIPYPEWAKRGLSGRAAHRKQMLADCRRDNPNGF